jgi:hypothetical protein
VREADVQLHDVGPQQEDVPEVGEAGAHVVDRDARPARPERSERLEQRVVVGDLGVLGELDDDSLRHAFQQFGEPLRESRRRRDVDGEVGALGEVVEPSQGGFHGRQLELRTQPDVVRLGEPRRGTAPRLGAEAGECLEGDDRSLLEVEDRLEDHVDFVTLQDPANARLAQAERRSGNALQRL